MSYRVLKEPGSGANVVVENTNTRANIIIGRLDTRIINILTDAGFEVNTDKLKLSDAWSLAINEDTAKQLVHLTMRMTKPIRDQRKPETKKQANKQIDAMDVMLGLASYCK